MKKAFTLVELLIVIAIIGILIGMLMPAVNSAREAARRMTCNNNLKQIALACHAYHEAHGTFPVSNAYDAPGDGTTPGAMSGAGWQLRILPMLEQQAIYDVFEPHMDGNFASGTGINHADCADMMKTPLAVFACPSDPSAGRTTSGQWQWAGVDVAVTSYKGSIGDSQMGGATSVHQGSPDCHTNSVCPGVFWRHTYLKPIKMAHIRDGSSSTFMIGEDSPQHNNHSTLYYANGDYASCHAPLNYKPNPPTPDAWWNVMSFRSVHPAGAHFAMADGSVHFVVDDIDYTLYQDLSTKAGGEIAQLPQ